jgi:hypothetical protein
MCRASGDVETLKLVGRAPVGTLEVQGTSIGSAGCSNGAVRRLAVAGAVRRFVCLRCWSTVTAAATTAAVGSPQLQPLEQEMSGDEDAEQGPQDWRGSREFAGLGHR